MPAAPTVAKNFGPRGDADLREEDRQAEVAQHEIGRKRHGPDERSDAAHLAETQRDQQQRGEPER